MRKIISLLLFFLSCIQSVAQEARLYKENEKWGLLGTEKKRLTPALYDQIIPGTPYSVVKKYEATTSQFKVGCINESGEVVIPLAYTDLRIEGLRIIACLKNQSGFVYGVITLKNEVVIPIEYKSVKALGTLRFAVENQKGLFALYTEEGVSLSDFSIDAILPYYKGYSVFEQNGLVGLLDREGSVKVEAKYRAIRLTEDGSIVAEKPATWQWVDTNAKVIRSLQADSVILHSTNLLLVKNKKGVGLLTKELSPRSDFYTSLEESKTTNLYVVKKQKYGVLTPAGSLLLSCVYDSIHIGQHFIYVQQGASWKIHSLAGKLLSTRSYEAFTENKHVALVKKNNYWGVLNENGKEIIACVYDSIPACREQQLAVIFKGKYGIISPSEQWLVAPQAHPVQLVNASRYLQLDGPLVTLKDFENKTYYFSNNHLTPVEDGFLENTSFGERWHISNNGVVTKLQQKPLQEFSILQEEHEGYRAIQKDGKWGFVDAQGRLRIANRYDAVKYFSEGLAPFFLLNKWGYLTKEDKIVIHPSYEDAQPFVDGFSIIKQKGGYGLLNKGNEIILPCRFEKITRLPNGYFELQNGLLYGLVDPAGKIIYEPKYQTQEIVGKYIRVQRSKKYGVLTLEGADVIPTSFDYLITSLEENVFLTATKGSLEILER
jgi:hypothetical protein